MHLYSASNSFLQIVSLTFISKSMVCVVCTHRVNTLLAWEKEVISNQAIKRTLYTHMEHVPIQLHEFSKKDSYTYGQTQPQSWQSYYYHRFYIFAKIISTNIIQKVLTKNSNSPKYFNFQIIPPLGWYFCLRLVSDRSRLCLGLYYIILDGRYFCQAYPGFKYQVRHCLYNVDALCIIWDVRSFMQKSSQIDEEAVALLPTMVATSSTCK